MLLRGSSERLLVSGNESVGAQVQSGQQLQTEWWLNVEDREAIVLLLGLLVALFVIAHLKQIRQFPLWPLPVLAASCLLLGWAVSVAESVVGSFDFDVIEHSLYAAHSCLLATWCFRLSVFRKDAQR